MISLILDKKNPTSRSQTFVNPASRVAVKSHFPFRLPITKSPQYFGQIPNPENTLPNSGDLNPQSILPLSLCAEKKKSNAPSSEQVYTIKPPSRGMDFKSNPLLFPALSTPSPPQPHEVYIERCTTLGYCLSECFQSSDTFLLLLGTSGTEIQCIF